MVKIGHAHSGMGKVMFIFFTIPCIFMSQFINYTRVSTKVQTHGTELKAFDVLNFFSRDLERT